MPPSARSKRPGLRSFASVKAPRSWPKISSSRRVAGIAAQASGTNGPLAATRDVVDGPRHALLARAGLAGDQDAGVGVGHGADAIEHALHGQAAPDDLLEALLAAEGLAQLGVLVAEAADLLDLAERDQDHVVVEGLQDVVEGALADGVDRGVDRAVAGDDDHLGVGAARLEILEELDARDHRHPDVGDEDVERLVRRGRRGPRLRRRPPGPDGRRA